MLRLHPPGPRPIGEFLAEAIADTGVRLKARQLYEQGDLAVVDLLAELARDPEFGEAVRETLNWHLGSDDVGSDDVGGRHRVPKERRAEAGDG